MDDRRSLYWKLALGAAILLSVLTFTPLITPIGTFRPTLLGMPYTLWTGILVTIALVVCTYAATRFFPPRETDSTS